MTYDKITKTLEAISQMGTSVKTKFDNLSFTSGLNDSPSGYLGHSGDYLVVNDGETGIHFTGIEKIAQDLTDYGFPVKDVESLPTEVIEGKLISYNCKLYMGCNGNWIDTTVDTGGGGEDVPPAGGGSTSPGDDFEPPESPEGCSYISYDIPSPVGFGVTYSNYDATVLFCSESKFMWQGPSWNPVYYYFWDPSTNQYVNQGYFPWDSSRGAMHTPFYLNRKGDVVVFETTTNSLGPSYYAIFKYKPSLSTWEQVGALLDSPYVPDSSWPRTYTRTQSIHVNDAGNEFTAIQTYGSTAIRIAKYTWNGSAWVHSTQDLNISTDQYTAVPWHTEPRAHFNEDGTVIAMIYSSGSLDSCGVLELDSNGQWVFTAFNAASQNNYPMAISPNGKHIMIGYDYTASSPPYARTAIAFKSKVDGEWITSKPSISDLYQHWKNIGAISNDGNVISFSLNGTSMRTYYWDTETYQNGAWVNMFNIATSGGDSISGAPIKNIASFIASTPSLDRIVTNNLVVQIHTGCKEKYLGTYPPLSDNVTLAFKDLTDTPNELRFHGSEIVAVNADESSLEFVKPETIIANSITETQFSYFSGLQDTPTGYLGHSGDYLVVNNGESGIHFTGIEKIAQDLDSIKYNEIPQYTTIDMPQADTQSGKIVASGCDLYYSCNGEWRPVNPPISAPKNAPSCISNIEEYVEYNEYREQFLSDNMLDSLKNALEYNIDPLVLDVCVNPESNLAIENNVVKIEETTYKWGLFNSAQTINISATPYSDTFGNDCVFENWDSSQASFANKLSPNTSVLVDQDMSITGYFRCNLAPSPISEEQVFLNVQSSNTEILEKSTYNHNLNNINGVVLDNQNQLFNTNTLNFTGASYIEVGESNDFQFLHDGSSDYTIEFWTKVEETPVTIDLDNPEGGSVGTQLGTVAGSPEDMFDGNNSTYYGINNFKRIDAFSMQLATWFTRPIENVDRIDWRFLVDENGGGRAIYIHNVETNAWQYVGGGPAGNSTQEVSFTNEGNVFPPFDAIKSQYDGSSSKTRNFRTYELRFYQNNSNPDVDTTTVNPVSATEPILSTANAYNMHGINIAIQGSSLQSIIYNGTNSPYLARLSSSTAIQANEWQHVALTFNKDLNKIYMHLNGVYQGEYATINNLSQSPQSQILKIGSSSNGFLNGNIQDLRISKGVIYSNRGPFFTPNQLF